MEKPKELSTLEDNENHDDSNVMEENVLTVEKVNAMEENVFTVDKVNANRKKINSRDHCFFW